MTSLAFALMAQRNAEVSQKNAIAVRVARDDALAEKERANRSHCRDYIHDIYLRIDQEVGTAAA